MAFEVGQKVTVWDGKGIMCITTVHAIERRVMVLANGMRFKISGYSINSIYATAPHVEPWEPAHDERVQRQRLTFMLENCHAWDSLPTSDLEAVAEIVRRTPVQGASK